MVREISPAELDAILLEKGSHQPDGKFCVMELAAWLAHEPWSDHPACTSPVIGAFLRSWNDAVDDDFRQRLKPYAVKVIGTNTGPADEDTRAWLATDWQIRVNAPAWLDLAGLSDAAKSLRDLPPILNSEASTAALPTIREAAKQGDAAWAAAGAAARAAAGAAAWAAAWAAAGDAARAAAGDAARAAAWAAAGDAARAAAGAAAWDAAGDAARDAAMAAAGAQLAPTVAFLQASALDLLDRMIAAGK